MYVHRLGARDQLPGQQDFKRMLIATAQASESTDSAHLEGNLFDSNDEQTTWRTKGENQFITLSLPQTEDIRRIDIEWDPGLTRDGTVEIITYAFNEITREYSINRMGYLFTVLETGEHITADEIRIIFKENGTHGISTIAIYGYDPPQ